MKKIIYSIGILAVALFVAIPAITNGAPDQDKDKGKNSPIVQAVQKNKDVRNQALSTSSTGTGTEARSKVKVVQTAKDDISSTTRNMTRNLERVRKDIYEAQKAHLVAQLNKAIANLEQIRGRIVSRIQSAEASGRNMLETKNALVIADSKIVAAKNAIAAFAGVSVTTSEVTSTTTATTSIATSTATSTTSTKTIIVDLAKPRQAGSAAIEAVKSAKKALVDVVVSIAQSMGVKNGDKSATTTSTSTPNKNKATSTATTTQKNKDKTTPATTTTKTNSTSTAATSSVTTVI